MIWTPSRNRAQDLLVAAGYTTSAAFVNVGVELSVRWSDAIHRKGHEEYRQGRAYGGRCIPPETIRALTDTEARRCRAACPPGMEAAAPAIDDPEPYVPGSFDDVICVYHLGIITDDEYTVLAPAAVRALREHTLTWPGAGGGITAANRGASPARGRTS